MQVYQGFEREINVECSDIKVIFNNVTSEICLHVCKTNMSTLKSM